MWNFVWIILTVINYFYSIYAPFIIFRLLNFNEPVEFRGAGIGRNQKDWFGIEAPYSGIIQPLETCAEMASYNTEMQAAKFGDEPYSHAKIPIGRKEFVDE